jgi:predicted TIM-barrel fold metal-dependent hydrolase
MPGAAGCWDWRSEMPRIDAHLHVFPPHSSQYPRRITPACPAERDENVEKLLQQMEAHGIDQAVLTQMGGGQIEDHAYLQHCLKTYPKRFRGIGLIPEDCAKPEAHMDRLAADGDIIGFRLKTLGGPRDPFVPMDVRTFGSYPIWKRAAEQDYVMWLYLRASDVHLSAYLIDAFPQVRVVINHMGATPAAGKFYWDDKGRPQLERPNFYFAMHTLHRLSRYENVVMHLSGQYACSKEPFPYCDLAGLHDLLLFSFGSKRLMWASDAPWIYEDPGYGAYTTIIEKLLPNIRPDELDDIMGHTAQRFLGFPGDVAGEIYGD